MLTGRILGAAQGNETAVITGTIFVNDQPPGSLATSIELELSQHDRPGELKKGNVSSDGEYRILNVRSGAYILTARAPGYKTVRIELEIISSNRVRGNTRIVLMPETSASTAEPKSGTVSRNELKASRKAIRQVELAEKSLQAGDLEKAERALENALREYPQYARAWFQKGRLEEKRGHLDEAADAYETAVREDADFYPAYARCAELFRVAEDTAGLRDITERWKKVQPLEAAPLYYSALACYQQGRFREALDEALVADSFPHADLPHLDLLVANCYMKLKEPANAAARMQQFLGSHPDDPIAPQVRESLKKLNQILATK